MDPYSTTAIVYNSINRVVEYSEGNQRLGLLILAEFFDCKKMPTNQGEIESGMIAFCDLLKLNVLKKVTHTFSPHGLSSVFVLSESHFSIHTWPEHDYIAIDLFSCKEISTKKAIQLLAGRFKCERFTSSVIPRGIGFPRQKKSSI